MNLTENRGFLHLLIILPLYALCYSTIDTFAFELLNGHLCYMPLWYCKIIAYLNHRYEGLFNVFFVVFSMFIAQAFFRRNQKALSIWQLIFCIIFYEAAYQILNILDGNPLLLRHSPSLEYELYFNLNTVIPAAKVYAPSSFPSGHAMLFGYFSSIVRTTYPTPLKRPLILISYLWCLPRLIGGAHWLSDVVTGFLLGVVLWKTYYSSLNTIKYLYCKVVESNHVSRDFLENLK